MVLPKVLREGTSGLRPPRVLTVVVDELLSEEVDWSSWYLTDEDDMGQPPEQDDAIDGARGGVRRRVEELGWGDARVGVDAFFAWVREHPLVRVSPDIYVLRDAPDPLPSSFQTWMPGAGPPVVAFEVVSQQWRKDYDDNPQKYAQLGAHELVIFDPAAARGASSVEERVAFQVYRRTDDGLFVRAEAGHGPVRCKSLDCYVVATETAAGAGFRLTYDPEGQQLVPTDAERALQERDEAARQRDEAARQRDEAARQRDEERDARLALEARIRELEARNPTAPEEGG